MFYQLKVSLWKQRLIQAIFRRISVRKFSGDLRTELIKNNVPGKSFVDIGCMWGIHGHYCFETEKHGLAGR